MDVAPTPPSLRERLAERSRAEIAGAALLLVLAVIAAGLWYWRSLPREVQVVAERIAISSGADADGTGGAADASGGPAAPAEVVVHVTGEVRTPGVYRLHEGDRIVDAIDAAGGATRGAILEALNLAAPLVDGTQVHIPDRREAAGAGASAGASGGGAAGSSAGGLLDINVATAADFEALPGIGAVIAQRIVDHRTANGPFTSIEGLLDVSGIGDATFAEIRDLVTV